MIENNNKFNYLIEGAYGEGNFGDDALLEVLLSKIFSTKESASIGVVCKSVPKYAHAIRFFTQVSWITKSTKNCKGDKYIYGGGTQFFEFPESSKLLYKIRNYLYVDGKLRLGSVFSSLRARFLGEARVTANQVVYLSIGLGPFHTRKKLQSTMTHLASADLIIVRDAISFAYCEQAKVPCQYLSDICFADDKARELRAKVSKTGVSRVAVVLRDWGHTKNVINASDVDKVLGAAVCSDIEVVYVCFGPDPKTKEELRSLGISFVSYSDDFLDVVQFTQYLAQFDLIVSARYHGIVYATLLGIPSVALNIEPKLAAASREMQSVALLDKSSITNLPSIILSLKDGSYKEQVEMCGSVSEQMRVRALSAIESSLSLPVC